MTGSSENSDFQDQGDLKCVPSNPRPHSILRVFQGDSFVVPMLPKANVFRAKLYLQSPLHRVADGPRVEQYIISIDPQ